MGEQQQHLASYFVTADYWQGVERALVTAGFEVRQLRRDAGTLMGVLVRGGTMDEDEATGIIGRFVPHVSRGPRWVPTEHVPDYRATNQAKPLRVVATGRRRMRLI